MGKLLLTKAAIKQIIALREDEDKNYSYLEISQVIEKSFDIKVTPNSIRRAYLKNKDTLGDRENIVNNILTKKNSLNIPNKDTMRKSFIKSQKENADADNENDYMKISRMSDKEYMEWLKQRKQRS